MWQLWDHSATSIIIGLGAAGSLRLFQLYAMKTVAVLGLLQPVRLLSHSTNQRFQPYGCGILPSLFGQQVLEWKNEEVVRRWLSRVPEAPAAVFFDDRNDLSVLSRNGITESLMILPFAKQINQCLVYLDEAYTRGTDLKLSRNYWAAVTLGPNLIKYRLI